MEDEKSLKNGRRARGMKLTENKGYRCEWKKYKEENERDR